MRTFSICILFLATPPVTMTCLPSSASASSCSSSSTSHLASPPVCAHCSPFGFSLSLTKSCSYASSAGLTPHSAFTPAQQSLAEVQHLRAKPLASPTQEATGFHLKDSSGGGGSSKNSSSCDTDDFVMVPAHFTSKKTSHDACLFCCCFMETSFLSNFIFSIPTIWKYSF